MFGLSAVLIPDANGDGIDDIAIAAPNAFDDVVGARIGTVSIMSGSDGSTIASLTGLAFQRFGLALFGASAVEPAVSPTVTVLVEHLDPATNQSFTPAVFTFQTFDAFSRWLVAESVQAPAGFTAQAAIDSLATHIRATGPADLNADGTVTASDLAILAGNYGAQLDPVTGALLHQDPTLAAAPTGDTNGDGVVDASDLVEVVTGIGSQNPDGSPNFVPVDDPLTEAEAQAIETAFGAAMGRHVEADCSQCTYRPCWCVLQPDDVDPFGEIDGDDGQDGVDTDGDGNPDLPEGGTPPGGGGGDGPDPDGDDDGDGIPNENDCDSEAFTGGGGGGNCDDPCGDDNGDGVKNQDDCESECYQGDPEDCECRVMIEGCPTPDGLPDNGVSPTEVIILPADTSQSMVVVLTASGEPADGTHHWFVVGAAADALDQDTIRLMVTNPGLVEASVTYTAQINDQQCTSRDRCAFLAWRCAIEPANPMLCLSNPPEPVVLTVDPYNTIGANLRWSVVQGASLVTTTGNAGTSFEVTPVDPGEVVVKCEYLLDGVVKCQSQVTLTIPGPVCGTNGTVSPAFTTIMDGPGFAGQNFGLTVPDKPIIDTEVCIDPAQGGWVNRVVSVQSTVRYAVNLHGCIDISGANHPAVNAQTYKAILVDLTPVGSFPAAPYSVYAALDCVAQHELVHVAEWEQTANQLWPQYEPRLETGIAPCALFSHAEDAERYFEVLTQPEQVANDFFDDVLQQWPDHPGTSQAYPIENVCLASLRAAILQRAQSNNWP